MLVSGVRMTVLSGRAGMCGEQETAGRTRLRYFLTLVCSRQLTAVMLCVSYSQLQLLNILPIVAVVGWLPVVVGWLLILMTSVVVDFVVVVVDFTASSCTVVIKEESAPAIHISRGHGSNVHTSC